jgi:hypothetical protein
MNLETLEEVEDLTAANLTTANLETLEEFGDLTAANLTAANLETLKEFEDLTAANLTAANLTAANLETLREVEDLTGANLVLKSHARGAEQELEGHKEADAEDVVKLKKAGEEVPSTRWRAQGGGHSGRSETEEGGQRGFEHEATGTRRPDVDDRGVG